MSSSQAISSIFVEKIGGQLMSNLDANSNNIINAANPVNAQDVATKIYVDNLSSSLLKSTDYEPPFITRQSPSFHFCADAYGTTEASIYDLTGTQTTISFSGVLVEQLLLME